MVRPDYCAVDHLQAGVATAAVVEGFEQQLPQARQRPAPELAVNRRPFAEMFVQVAPSNTRPRNPENPIQNKAMISRTPPAARTALDHEWRKTGPFLVTHQTPDHGSLLSGSSDALAGGVGGAGVLSTAPRFATITPCPSKATPGPCVTSWTTAPSSSTAGPKKLPNREPIVPGEPLMPAVNTLSGRPVGFGALN
jgi:hypothetical protein